MKRQNLTKIKEAIRQKCAWPGGYPLSFFFWKCGVYCADCARKEWRLIADQTMHPARDCGWGIAGVDVQWEDGSPCEKCGANLDAYPSEETEE